MDFCASRGGKRKMEKEITPVKQALIIVISILRKLRRLKKSSMKAYIYPKNMRISVLVFLLFLICYGCSTEEPVSAPAPVLPTPSAQQVAWQQMEFYAFVHFNMNTFTDREWGYGDEDPATFSPTDLDCRQWARVCKEAGMQGIIITAKHHDGFCLWPSKYTEHSVKNAPWRDGQGDLIRELADACREYGLKLGIYYSPWDRNHPDYGRPEYLDYMRNQLTELLTNYGPVYEVWFDGANGGTGYYGGAREERRVDKQSYYDWPNTHALVKELQPDAVIFSDAGPDVRWVGNEEGYAYETMWSNLFRDSVYAGMPEYSRKWASGQEDGTHFVPGETNVSIRPGWYYHAYEDHKVRSLPALVDMYYHSIGRNTNFLLNFPVDRRGLIHERDVERLRELKTVIDRDFAKDLAPAARIRPSASRGSGFEAVAVLDDDFSTYWAAPDGQTQADLILSFSKPVAFNRILLQEYIPLGQRIKAFSVEVEEEGEWKTIAEETTVGYKRILRLPQQESARIRLRIRDAKACPTLAKLALFQAPPLMVPPEITRNQQGMVRIDHPEEALQIFYTTDGTEPSAESEKYQQPFSMPEAGIVRVFLQSAGGDTLRVQKPFDMAPIQWTIRQVDTALANRILDGDAHSWWAVPENRPVVIDLGQSLELRGVRYLPMQERWISGFISAYEIHVSMDGNRWRLVKKGEFSNIYNNPIEQRVTFTPQKARFLKFVATATVDGEAPGIAELGVITKP